MFRRQCNPIIAINRQIHFELLMRKRASLNFELNRDRAIVERSRSCRVRSLRQLCWQHGSIIWERTAHTIIFWWVTSRANSPYRSLIPNSFWHFWNHIETPIRWINSLHNKPMNAVKLPILRDFTQPMRPWIVMNIIAMFGKVFHL